MTQLHGHEILSLIYESSCSQAYGALSNVDKVPLGFKVLKPGFSSPEEVTFWIQEHGITRLLEGIPGVVNVYSPKRIGNTFAIVPEDFEGRLP